MDRIAKISHGNYVGMLQTPQRLGFDANAIERAQVVAQLGTQQLRHEFAADLAVQHQEHLAHAPRSDLPNSPILRAAKRIVERIELA